MNLIDCHSHTHNSPDGDGSVLSMCRRAMELGLKAYAVTDHCEVNRFYSSDTYTATPKEYDTYDFGIDFEKSMEENTKVKNKLGEKLNFICGIELGQATFDMELADKIVSDPRLDFILGSVHQIPDAEDFAFIDYNTADATVLLERYFDEMIKLCRWGKFDVLSHLTYALRYMEGEKGLRIDMTPYQEKIRTIFTLLIQSGKGIEINTSGFRQKYGKPLPTLDYIKLFRELGGEVLSVGSDSHFVTDLGKNIRDGAEMAKEAGFKYLCYFKERKPRFIPID